MQILVNSPIVSLKLSPVERLMSPADATLEISSPTSQSRSPLSLSLSLSLSPPPSPS